MKVEGLREGVRVAVCVVAVSSVKEVSWEGLAVEAVSVV